MAEINYTVHHWVTGNTYVVTWASMSSSSGSMDYGQPFPQQRDLHLIGGLFSDKSVQVIRPSGTDTQILMRMSNQPNIIATTAFAWASLTDPQGNGLQIPPSGQNVWAEAILENCCYISPQVTTTSYTTAANGTTVHLLLSSIRSSRSGV